VTTVAVVVQPLIAAAKAITQSADAPEKPRKVGMKLTLTGDNASERDSV
jgi:hypothetical protein